MREITKGNNKKRGVNGGREERVVGSSEKVERGKERRNGGAVEPGDINPRFDWQQPQC